ncbi:MAG: PLP-dependent aspartate aminotransferase family protein [Saprospiraceae bacterium]|nr:PLP-dependent aspartate aminotransferase family protein [Saprospiraceae bacterium]
MHLSDILFHLGEDRSKYFNAVAPPIIQSSNFAFDSIDQFRSMLQHEMESHIYTRGNNPTVEILRKKISALEKAEDTLVFSSGSAAISMALLSQIQSGDHVICVSSPYTWTKLILQDYLPRFGVSHTFVDAREVTEIEACIQDNSKVLFLESPNSMTFELQDLSACAKLAKQHGLITMIDNSYSSPIYQNPIEHGIDLVIHSGTKYLNGHSDVVMGTVSGKKEHIERIFHAEYMTLGAIISPNDAALAIRGLRTLELRLQRSHESALKIAEQLDQHPKVKQVLHPFLPSFPQHALALRQMRGAGGLFSIHLDIERIEQAEAFVHALKHFTMAVSWGGHESLVLPTAAFYKIKGRDNSPLPFTLVRLYIGLEDPDWLLEDLLQALEKMG